MTQNQINFCKSILIGNQIQLEHAISFIIEWCELKKISDEHIDFVKNNLQGLVQALQMHMLNLATMVEEYCALQGYQITAIKKDGRILDIKIVEDGERKSIEEPK